jgi:hypothetical protein
MRCPYCGKKSQPRHLESTNAPFDSDLKSEYRIGDEIPIMVDQYDPKNPVILDPYI